MSRGHNITRCQYCNREYMCGDCISRDCELGHDRKSCEDYQLYIRQHKSMAQQMQRMAESARGKQRAMGLLLADVSWDAVVESLTNSELAEELKLKVWANHKIGTWEIALVTQAIERLNKQK